MTTVLHFHPDLALIKLKNVLAGFHDLQFHLHQNNNTITSGARHIEKEGVIFISISGVLCFMADR